MNTSCECGRAVGCAEEMLDDLSCAACGRQCRWACVTMLMTAAYCRPCAALPLFSREAFFLFRSATSFS